MELRREGVDLIDFEGIVGHSNPVERHDHPTKRAVFKNVLVEVKVHVRSTIQIYIRRKTP